MWAVVYGTRPEAIKLAPIAAELRALGVPFVALCTGQHTTLLEGTPAVVDLPAAVSLQLPSTDGRVGLWIAKAVPVLVQAYRDHGVTKVVVQGDTMSVLAATHAARLLGLPVAHVEAGLRSHDPDEPWPEERIRVAMTTHAQLHLAPTETAKANLLAEGVAPDTIHVTGNSGISALHRYGVPANRPFPFAPLFLLTMHRREWLDEGDDVLGVFQALRAAAEDHPRLSFVWPMHPNVKKRWDVLGHEPAKNVAVINPLPYREMTGLVGSSWGLITDSGGLQEEAAALGVKTAVLRRVTDRPESVQLGLAKLFPPTGDGLRSAIEAVTDPTWVVSPSDCYGDALSASKIAAILRDWVP